MGISRFKRPAPFRRYRQLFIIATEGIETEEQYFALFNSDSTIVRVKCLSERNRTSPEYVLKRIKKYIQQEGLRKGDFAWIVIDTDSWKTADIKECALWAGTSPKYGLAVSSPKFEYWLLLHFRNIAVRSSKDCTDKLKHHIPDYDKHINGNHFTKDRIRNAITNAKARDVNRKEAWPTSTGTTVYQLVEQLIKNI